MPVDGQFVLFFREVLSGGNPQLPFHEVDACNRLCHRVFDLKPGIHLHEIKAIAAQSLGGIDNKLHRACAFVADGFGGAHSGIPHGRAHFIGHARCRGFLDDFLVAALQGTIPFEKMHRLVAVTKHLNFDMAGLGYKFFDQNIRVSKSGAGLTTGAFQRGDKIAGLFNLAHAFATTAGDRLDQNRIADFIGAFRQEGVILIAAVIAGHDRDTGLFHQRFCRVLETHRPDRFRRRTDKDETGGLYRFDEIGVLGEKPIARMDRLRAGFKGGANNHIGFEIALGRSCAADMDRVIGHLDMAGSGIRVRIDRHASDTHATCGLYDPAGDFAAIGNQNRVKHRSFLRGCGLDRGLSAPGPPRVFRARGKGGS